MCDIWKANHEKKELSVEHLEKHVADFKKLGVKEVVFSGGEALMHSNLWQFCEVLKRESIRITLLSTGLLLERHANEITRHLNEVIVSLDGSETVHDRIRNIPNGFQKITAGISALKKINRSFKVTARCVLQRYNFSDFQNIVQAAQAIGLDQISFLAADVTSQAFNRTERWNEERASEVALNIPESSDFEAVVEKSFTVLESAYRSGFIAESPQKMRKIVQYYKAVNGLAEYPQTVCNAPWVSAVIESDGSVMPCFFHKPYGNIRDRGFIDLINSAEAIAFRKQLDVGKDEVCKKCVCSLKLGLSQMN
jgi:MoaA/NifB/PqqE/SkfB family radical SAM enzyme